MFERVGRAQDSETRRREFVSFGFTSLMFGAGVVGFFLGSMLVVSQAEEPLIVEEIVFADPGGGGLSDRPIPEAPALAKPAPTPQAEPDPAAIPTAESTPIAETSTATAAQAGTSAGTGGGTGGGHGLGKGLGIGDCEADCDDDGVQPINRPKIYHHDPLKVLRKVEPRYPESVRPQALGPQRCVATITVGRDGSPTGVDVEGCVDAFHAPTREALLKWRFKPPTDGKTLVEGRTRVAITFMLD